MRATEVTKHPLLRCPRTRANLLKRLIEHCTASEVSGTLGLFFSLGLKSFSAADSYVNYRFPQSRINSATALACLGC